MSSTSCDNQISIIPKCYFCKKQMEWKDVLFSDDNGMWAGVPDRDIIFIHKQCGDRNIPAGPQQQPTADQIENIQKAFIENAIGNRQSNGENSTSDQKSRSYLVEKEPKHYFLYTQVKAFNRQRGI